MTMNGQGAQLVYSTARMQREALNRNEIYWPCTGRIGNKKGHVAVNIPGNQGELECLKSFVASP